MLMLSFVGADGPEPHIHLALFGNPGTGKSTLIRFMTSLHEEGNFVTGTHTSQAGLTMSKTTNPNTG